MEVEPFLDLNTKTFYHVEFETKTEKVPQGYDNGVSEFYTKFFIEFDWLSGYKNDLGLGYKDGE